VGAFTYWPFFAPVRLPPYRSFSRGSVRRSAIIADYKRSGNISLENVPLKAHPESFDGLLSSNCPNAAIW
jgi:hypothetical protein